MTDDAARHEPKPGQIWYEIDPRIDRKVVILEVSTDYVRIATVNPDSSVSRRKSQAMRKRFGGTRRGHYGFVSDAP